MVESMKRSQVSKNLMGFLIAKSNTLKLECISLYMYQKDFRRNVHEKMQKKQFLI